jgi:hypothetical protein
VAQWRSGVYFALPPAQGPDGRGHAPCFEGPRSALSSGVGARAISGARPESRIARGRMACINVCETHNTHNIHSTSRVYASPRAAISAPSATMVIHPPSSHLVHVHRALVEFDAAAGVMGGGGRTKPDGHTQAL